MNCFQLDLMQLGMLGHLQPVMLLIVIVKVQKYFHVENIHLAFVPFGLLIISTGLQCLDKNGATKHKVVQIL